MVKAMRKRIPIEDRPPIFDTRDWLYLFGAWVGVVVLLATVAVVAYRIIVVGGGV